MLAYSFPAFSTNREISRIVNSTELAADLELVFDKDGGSICFLFEGADAGIPLYNVQLSQLRELENLLLILAFPYHRW
jgi:hypothetical protein